MVEICYGVILVQTHITWVQKCWWQHLYSDYITSLLRVSESVVLLIVNVIRVVDIRFAECWAQLRREVVGIARHCDELRDRYHDDGWCYFFVLSSLSAECAGVSRASESEWYCGGCLKSSLAVTKSGRRVLAKPRGGDLGAKSSVIKDGVRGPTTLFLETPDSVGGCVFCK